MLSVVRGHLSKRPMFVSMSADSDEVIIRQLDQLGCGQIARITRSELGGRDEDVEWDSPLGESWCDDSECVDVTIVERDGNSVVGAGAEWHQRDRVGGAEPQDRGDMILKLTMTHVVDRVDVAIHSVSHRVVRENAKSSSRLAADDPRCGGNGSRPEPLCPKREGHGADTCAVTMPEVYGESALVYGKVEEWEFRSKPLRR